jgi:hypothetical protein
MELEVSLPYLQEPPPLHAILRELKPVHIYFLLLSVNLTYWGTDI